MKGLVFLGEGRMEFRDYPDPVPGPDEVVVRIKASGMCGSDLDHLNEPERSESQIVIEGHEPCGIIEQVGSAVRSSEAKVGDRVMVYHYDGCRTCPNCRSGWLQNCDNTKIAFGGNGHGGHAHFMKVPAHTILRLPDQLSFKAGAAVSCGTGTAYAALKRINLAADDTVAIFGQGPVGLSCTLLAKAFGARVIALDVGEERLQMARDMGADFTINSLQQDPVEQIRALTRGLGADKAIECSSNATARQQAMTSVCQWGTTCLVGVHGSMQFECNELITKQKTLVGSLTFSKNLQDECAKFVAERGINLDTLFTHEFKLEQAVEAYALFAQRKIGKGVFLFE
ncbi:threonine dehydrogenase-like Zn-dependent dehydrogenase [Rhizobium sp. SLBN-94]|nr:threonine dehydrogenase-like Zn-dependent dehydrogenase [Rhizobium sp. SLBN-94]